MVSIGWVVFVEVVSSGRVAFVKVSHGVVFVKVTSNGAIFVKVVFNREVLVKVVSNGMIFVNVSKEAIFVKAIFHGGWSLSNGI